MPDPNVIVRTRPARKPHPLGVHAPGYKQDVYADDAQVDELVDLNDRIKAAEQVKRLPQLRKERDALVKDLDAQATAAVADAERLVREYEEAREGYADVQDRLMMALPMINALLLEVHQAERLQDRTLRAAQKVQSDLPAKVLPPALRAAMYDEPYRGLIGELRTAVKLVV